MSHAVRRVADSATADHGQAPPTATVLDYMCLFTHDLRRKQKRWQDGKLKYHTFNKRIMVYDDRGNFVGDGHWHASGDLEEGEELELDRGAAIVQVADCVGAKEQDLTEILDKRAREVEKRRAIAAAKTPTSRRARPQHQPNDQQVPPPHFQMNHRPLSSIVPSPGPIGRAAISEHSPYEARRVGGDAPRARKKRSSVSPPSKAGFAQNLFGTKLNLSTCASSITSLRMRATIGKMNTQVEERTRTHEDDVVVVRENTKVVPLVQSKVQNGKTNDILPKQNGRAEPPAEDSTPLAAYERVSAESEVEEVISTTPQVAGRQLNRQAVMLGTQAYMPIQSLHRTVPNKVSDVSQPKKIQEVSISGARPRKTQKSTSSPTQIDNESVAPLASRNATHIETKQKLQHAVDNAVVPNNSGKPSVPPQPVHPRTELRIKSRPRRGLLMIAERKQEQSLGHPKPVTRLPLPEALRTPAMRSPSVRQLDTFESMHSDAGNEEEEVTKETPANACLENEIEHGTKDSAIEDKIDPRAPLLPDKPCSEAASRNNTKLDAKDGSSKMSNTRDPTPPRDTESINIVTENELKHAKRSKNLSLAKQPESEPEAEFESESEAVIQRPRKRKRRVPKTPQLEDDSSNGEEGDGPPKNTQRKARGQASSKPQFDQPDAQEKPQAPRIARMARKSVKSKEIFGFVPPVEETCLIPIAFTMAASRIGTVGRPPIVPARPPGVTLTIKPSSITDPTSKKLEELKVNQESVKADQPKDGDEDQEKPSRTESLSNEPVSVPASSETAPCQEETLSIRSPPMKTNSGALASRSASPSLPVPVNQAQKERKGTEFTANRVSSMSMQNSKAKVFNPATRGKKAARKQDAAGAIPQSIVPFEAPQAARVPPSRTTKPPEPSKRPGDLLGFSKANGGAWSKHAEDLLGMTRPTGRRGT